MKKTFSKKCYLSYEYFNKQEIQKVLTKNLYKTINDFLDWPISLFDKLGFVYKCTELTLVQKQDLALTCAKVSLEIYKNKYPNDNRVDDCIVGIENFIKGKINRKKLLELVKRARKASEDASNPERYTVAEQAASSVEYVSRGYIYDSEETYLIGIYQSENAAFSAKNKNKLFNALKEWCNKQK